MAKQETKFGFYQILGSKRYLSKRDIIWVVLKPDESYTLAEVDAKIDEFLKSEVK